MRQALYRNPGHDTARGARSARPRYCHCAHDTTLGTCDTARKGAGHGASGTTRSDAAEPGCDTTLGGIAIRPRARSLGVPVRKLGVLVGSAGLCVCTLCT